MLALLPAIYRAIETQEDSYVPRWKWKKAFGDVSATHKPRSIAYAPPTCSYKQTSGDRYPSAQTSPALLAAIREYETYHAASAQAESFTKGLHKRVDGLQDIASRYLVFAVRSCADGLGNRVLPLVSSYLLAMLTQRILLVDFDDYPVDDILCNPLGNSSWTFPRDAKWPKIRSANRRGGLLSVSELDGDQAYKLATLAISDRSDASGIGQLVCGGDLQRTWRNVQIVRVTSNCYFAPVLFANPFYRQRLQALFPRGDVAHQLLRYLLLPTDQVHHRLQKSLAPMTKGHFNGLQFRTFASRLDMRLVDRALACIEEATAGAAEDARMTLFLASLHADVLARHISDRTMWNVTFNYADGVQIPGKGQAANALHDVLLLANSRHLFVSPRSTLGYVATALRGGNVLFIPSAAQGIARAECQHESSSEPCFHKPLSILEEAPCLNQGAALQKVLADLFIPCHDAIGFKLRDRHPLKIPPE